MTYVDAKLILPEPPPIVEAATQMNYPPPRRYMWESKNIIVTEIMVSGHIDQSVTDFSKEIWKRIELLYKFSQETGSISYDSETRIDDASLYASRRFLSSLPVAFPLPRIAPDGDGGVMFVWNTNSKTTIMVIEGSVFHLVKNAGTDKAEYFDNIPLQEIPPLELISALS
jgi:hypothetical protein